MNSTRIHAGLAAVLGALAVFAAAGSLGQTDGNPPPAVSAPAGERITVTEQDLSFLRNAHPLAEVSLAAARLAVVKGESESARKLGRDIIADQTTANEELKRLASQHGIALPQGLSAGRREALARLERASGPDFDREYLKLQKEKSDAALELFRQQARSGTGPFKTYAEATLLRLQEHHKSLGGR